MQSVHLARYIYNQFMDKYFSSNQNNQNTKEIQNMLGLNLQDQIFLNDQWNLLLGGRFNRLEQQIDDYRTGISAQQKFTRLSPRVGVKHIKPSIVIGESF